MVCKITSFSFVFRSLIRNFAGGKKLKEKNYGNNHRKITDITSD